MADFLQTIATGIALIALFFNASQVRLLRKQNEQNETKARQRATIDLALHERTDKIYIDCKSEFYKLRNLAKEDSTKSLTIYACDLNKYQEQNKNLMNYLNHYEFLACGIFEEALHFTIFDNVKQ